MLRRVVLSVAVVGLLLGMVWAGCKRQPKEAPAGEVSKAGTDGKALFDRRCKWCHDPYQPSDFTDEEWKEIMQRMGERIPLKAEEEQKILAYLQSAN